MYRVRSSASLRRYLVAPPSSIGVLSAISVGSGPATATATATAVSFSTGAVMPFPRVLPQVTRAGLVAVAQKGKRVSGLRSLCVCEPRRVLLNMSNSGM